MNKAVFLDRDGTINVEIHYLHEPDKFEFINGVPEALTNLKNNKFELIVITNQGAIGKGMYTHTDVELTHKRMNKLLKEEGIYLRAIYYCPHSSEENCDCRKPKPGMILKAIDEYNINPSESWMIGDKLSDIEAGKEANLKTILVMTGYGLEHKKLLEELSSIEKGKKTPDYFADNLLEAVNIILKLNEIY